MQEPIIQHSVFIERRKNIKVEGVESVTAGNFLIGNGNGTMQEKTPEEILSHIGASEFTELWRNASPNSTFGERGISVPNLSNYFVFAIVTSEGTYLLSTSTTNRQPIVTTSLDYSDKSIKVHVRFVTVDENALSITANHKENLQDTTGYDEENQAMIIPYGVYGVYKKG